MTDERKVSEFNNLVHERCANGGDSASKKASSEDAIFREKLAVFSKRSHAAMVSVIK